METEALDICKKIFGSEHPEYANSLSGLANCRAKQGKYGEAIRLGEEVLKIRERIFGTEHPASASAYANLALYNSAFGNYTEVMKLETKALDILERTLGKEHPDYAVQLLNLANYNRSIGNDTIAIKLTSDALDIFQEVYGNEHPYYASAVGNLSTLYLNIGEKEKAVTYAEEALSIREKTLGKSHPDYARALVFLAIIDILRQNNIVYPYPNTGALSISNIGSFMEALNIFEETVGKENNDYLNLLLSTALINRLQGDILTFESETNEISYLLSNLIKNNFIDFTTNQRALFWESYKSWYQVAAHTYSFINNTNFLVANGYNSALISKGLLLNSEIEFSKLIQESGDGEAVRMYEELKRLRIQINKLREKPISERFADVDSMTTLAQAKESQLMARSKVYGDYTKNIVITWEQVQEKLTDKDMSVEFVSFPLNADSTIYVAYVLRKDWEFPKMIPLLEEKELLAISDRYGTDSISSLVWKPLDEVMHGVENVYFAPSGELYNIAIESVPTHEDGGSTLIGEHGRNYYRLSSTRELSLIKEESRWEEAAVYGGLQYDMSVQDMIKEDVKYESIEGVRRGDSTPEYYAKREERDYNPGLSTLSGTRREAIAIKTDLDKKEIPAALFIDSIGTETSFKNLSGKRKSIIHIGTHGFFNDVKQEYRDDGLQALMLNGAPRLVEDYAMTRSGLYFAGANNALQDRSSVPDSIDDGILKASEIAQLDLRGLDLVVLSACQTGLGEITGDGVFGLQRGFKKAGAQTIVMSLWKVDDDATTEFMTTFFKNIKIEDGRPTNKYQAFKDAQNELRKSKDKYSDKNCWAAFVMLDGVN